MTKADILRRLKNNKKTRESTMKKHLSEDEFRELSEQYKTLIIARKTKEEIKLGLTKSKLKYDVARRRTSIARLTKVFNDDEIFELLKKHPDNIITNEKVSSFNGNDVLSFINEYYTNLNTQAQYKSYWQKFVTKYEEETKTEFNGEILEKNPRFFIDVPGEKALLSVISKYIREKHGLSYTNFHRYAKARFGEIQQEYKDEAYERVKNDNLAITLPQLNRIWEVGVHDFYRKEARTQYDYENMILVGFYALVTGFRDDFGNIYLAKNKRQIKINKNSIDLKNGIFHLRDYKTAKSYGNKTYEIPYIIKNFITLMLANFPHKKALIGNDVPFLRKKMGKRISNFIHRYGSEFSLGERQIRTNDIRRAWTSAYLGKSLGERQELANRMCHSLMEAETVYRRT